MECIARCAAPIPRHPSPYMICSHRSHRSHQIGSPDRGGNGSRRVVAQAAREAGTVQYARRV